MDGIVGQISDPKVVEELWGEEFVQFVKSDRVIITENALYVKLKVPVTSPTEGGKTDIIKINEPTVGELKTMDTVKGDMSKAATLLETLAGITSADMNKMKASDFILINKIMNIFLLDGPETGETA